MILFVGVALAGNPTFAVPDGWTDLSPGRSLDGLNDEDKTRAQAAAKAHYLLYAVDQKTEDGFPDNVNAHSQPKAIYADEASIEALVTEMQDQTDGQLHVVKSEARKVAGVDCVRFEATFNTGDDVARQLYYIMPVGNESIVLVYSTAKDTWESMKPTFDAAAAKTTGLSPASAYGWGTILLLSLVGGVLGGGVAGGLAWLVRRNRKEE